MGLDPGCKILYQFKNNPFGTLEPNVGALSEVMINSKRHISLGNPKKSQINKLLISIKKQETRAALQSYKYKRFHISR